MNTEGTWSQQLSYVMFNTVWMIVNCLFRYPKVCTKYRKHWLNSYTHISNCVYFKIFWPKCNLKTKLTFSYTVSKLDLFCHWFFYKAKKLILAGNPNETYWLIHECSWSAIWFRYQKWLSTQNLVSLVEKIQHRQEWGTSRSWAKVSYFFQCTKMQLITSQNFNIQTCFFFGFSA